ncbi:MAG TPA: copper chaperone PCu(A)C [Geminicoccaceae bacterium]
MKAWLTAVVLLVAAGAVQGAEIHLDDAWVRVSLGAVPNSAAYMTIRSDAPDRLTGASSPAAKRVELHTTTMHAGVSQMRRLQAVEVGPGSPAVLQPGGMHLMLLGLTGRLEEGDAIRLDLEFEQAGTVAVEVPVRGLRAGGGSGHGPGGHGSGGHGSGG